MNVKKKISILVPAFNEEDGIVHFYYELQNVIGLIKNYDFNVIFIDDGSSDFTLNKIKELKQENPLISYLSLSKNCGKEIALAAGLDHIPVGTDAIIIMDSDLQHPPGVIPQFIEKWERGAEDVFGARVNRDYESFYKKTFTKVYYYLLKSSTKEKIDMRSGDFRLLDKKAYLALNQFRETQRYTKGLYSLIGFKKDCVEFIVPERRYGYTKWTFLGLVKLALDGITSYTTAPLRLATILGLFFSVFSFFYMFVIVFKTLIFGEPVAGFPTLTTLILFLGGVQIFCIGIIGEYLGKIFYESKNRPLYFVSEYER
jgi:polyisoprenyl-phosphate glycosyltransferase